MYTTVLILHSWLRWVALVAGVGATMAAMRDAAGARRVDAWGMALVTALDLQLLLGVLLYFFVSPNMAGIRADFGASMKDPAARFWAVEHVTMMLVAVILVHVGRVLGRKATPDSKRMKLFICFGIATALMFLAIPWPGMRAGRPLFRF